jgi:ParB family chromosome partitioning protein
MAKPALGRGLSALLGGKTPGGAAAATTSPSGVVVGAAAGGGVVAVPDAEPARPAVSPAVVVDPIGVALGQGVAKVAVGRVRPSSLQPRRDFPAESLQELSDSIREQGILQPLVVRAQGEFFELIAGERRWRAAQLAGLMEVPVVLREADDSTALELMLVENLQREGLNPMDEAQGYAELIERFQLTQESVATKVGRSRAAVANALRLLKLPTKIQAGLRDGRVSTGHAKVILGLPQPDLQEMVAKKVTEESLSVRQTEEWVARLGAEAAARVGTTKVTSRGPEPVTVRDPHIAALEDRLRQRLGTKVAIRYQKGRGQIDIRFFSDDELERVLEIVGVRLD